MLLRKCAESVNCACVGSVKIIASSLCNYNITIGMISSWYHWKVAGKIILVAPHFYFNNEIKAVSLLKWLKPTQHLPISSLANTRASLWQSAARYHCVQVRSCEPTSCALNGLILSASEMSEGDDIIITGQGTQKWWKLSLINELQLTREVASLIFRLRTN